MTPLINAMKSRWCVAIKPTNSDRELRGLVHDLSDLMDSMDARNQEYEPPSLVLHGFNEDPRKLWEIPRAVETIKRAHAAGFVAVLEPSALTGPRAMGLTWGLGALEVWLIASGRFKAHGLKIEIDPMELLDFVAEVMPAEVQRVRRMIATMRAGGDL
ncbi:MAG: hypothetical protein ACK5AC_12755 [Planctomycetota bacterium]